MQQALHSRASHASRGHCAQLRRLDKAAVRPVAVVANPTATTAVDSMAAKPEKTYKNGILFQAFGWDSCKKGDWYKTVQSKVDDLKAAGISHVWLPPPSQSVSPQGYMPGQLYNLTSKYGSKQDLMELNKSLTAAGIQPIADIVINHRCADEAVDGVYNNFRDDCDHRGKRIDWGAWAITSDDPVFGGTGSKDTGEDYGPAPDLDHANPDLRAALKDWMAWLQEEIGFKGWRLDFVKGYAAEYVSEYISATVGAGALCVGEDWVDMLWEHDNLAPNQDGPRQKLCDFIDANGDTCGAFDFPTKGILQEACKKTQYWRLRDRKGKPAGLIGWWPSRAVTFIDNHDTGSTQQHWPFPSEHVAAGYAYILTHPGVPCIFWDHMFGWGADLTKTIHTLIDIRRRSGIVADSQVDIKCAEGDLYVAVINDSVCLKLGPRYDMGQLLPDEKQGWKVATYGKDFCVWVKGRSG